MLQILSAKELHNIKQGIDPVLNMQFSCFVCTLCTQPREDFVLSFSVSACNTESVTWSCPAGDRKVLDLRAFHVAGFVSRFFVCFVLFCWARVSCNPKWSWATMVSSASASNESWGLRMWATRHEYPLGLFIFRMFSLCYTISKSWHSPLFDCWLKLLSHQVGLVGPELTV